MGLNDAPLTPFVKEFMKPQMSKEILDNVVIHGEGGGLRGSQGAFNKDSEYINMLHEGSIAANPDYPRKDKIPGLIHPYQVDKLETLIHELGHSSQNNDAIKNDRYRQDRIRFP